MKIRSSAMVPQSTDRLPNGAYSSDLALRLKQRGQWYFDLSLALALARLFQSKTVGDFGCGIGRYTDFLNTRGVACRGYDAIPDIRRLTATAVDYLDLSVPLPPRLHGKFHWVLCLEVMEHISRQFEATALKNLDAGNRCGIVISWAVPGQGGHGHVNEQVNQHAVDWFDARGYAHDRATQKVLRQAARIRWFKSTTMVFRKQP